MSIMWCDQAKCFNFRALALWKPHQNLAYGSRDIAILVMLKTKEIDTIIAFI